MRPALESWAVLIDGCRELNVPIIYTTPVSRADGADVVMLPTDLSAETGTPPLTNCVEGSDDASFPDLIAPRKEDYVFLKRRPSAFYGTGVAELLHMLRRDTIVIGGGGSNRGVETSVREAFNMDIMAVVVREVCYGGNNEAHEWSMNVAMKMFARIRTLEQTLTMLRG
jgi:maleamate amidohydrolase